MKTIAHIAARLDAVCARLNDGLIAVAVVLAVVTGAVAVAQLPDAAWQNTDVPAP
jgi:hypothetical protein